MYYGKRKCEFLKSIRKRIADENNIPYTPNCCTHEGDCRGTCPACESEVRYLETQLTVRRLAGEVVKIVGLSSVVSLSACSSPSAPEASSPSTEFEELSEPVEVRADAMDSLRSPVDSFAEKDSLPPPLPYPDGVAPGSMGYLEPKEVVQTVAEDTVRNFVDEEGCQAGCLPVDSSQESEKDDAFDEEIYLHVEKRAQYPGGKDSLQHYLSKNLVYPAKAREEGIQGVVLVGFVVNKDGSLSNIRVQRSVDESLDQEAIRLVKNMGNWEPALLKNSPVRTMCILPIKFIEK